MKTPKRTNKYPHQVYRYDPNEKPYHLSIDIKSDKVRFRDDLHIAIEEKEAIVAIVQGIRTGQLVYFDEALIRLKEIRGIRKELVEVGET